MSSILTMYTISVPSNDVERQKGMRHGLAPMEFSGIRSVLRIILNKFRTTVGKSVFGDLKHSGIARVIYLYNIFIP